MKIKTDYNHCQYITAGKEYDVIDINVCDQSVVYIIDNDGDRTPFIIGDRKCPHLGGAGSWVVVDDNDSEPVTNKESFSPNKP